MTVGKQSASYCAGNVHYIIRVFHEMSPPPPPPSFVCWLVALNTVAICVLLWLGSGAVLVTVLMLWGVKCSCRPIKSNLLHHHWPFMCWLTDDPSHRVCFCVFFCNNSRQQQRLWWFVVGHARTYILVEKWAWWMKEKKCKIVKFNQICLLSRQPDYLFEVRNEVSHQISCLHFCFCALFSYRKIKRCLWRGQVR